jgi:hypothetical protein
MSKTRTFKYNLPCRRVKIIRDGNFHTVNNPIITDDEDYIKWFLDGNTDDFVEIVDGKVQEITKPKAEIKSK